MAASKTYSMTYEMSATGGSNVSAAFGEAQQALVELQTEIESLNKTQSDISAYEKQQEAVEKSRLKVENYREQLENLKAAQQLANSSASEASEAYQRQAEAVEEARKYADSLKEQLAALKQEQQESGDSSEEMANRVQDMAMQVDAAEEEVRQQESALSGMNAEQREAGTEALNTANKVLNMQNKLDNAEQTEAKQEARLNKMGEKLRDAGVDTNDLASESDRLEAQINELKDAELQAGDAAEEFGDKGSQSIDAVATMLASSGIMKGLKEVASAFMDCINTAADFEKEMSNVEALSGATGEELENLTAIAQEMGATTSFTASEAAEGLSYMALAGWDTESMMQGLEPILNLAAASAMDLGTASDIVTDYLTAFGLSAADAAEFTDQMAYAMSNSNTTTEQLGEAYKSCAASASSMGFSVEDTTAAIMVMSNAGIKGSEAGTALNAVMTRLATDTKGCATALGEYGVAVYDNEGNMNSLSDILTGMAGIWGDLTDAEQASLSKTIAGTSHYAALQTVMDGCSEAAAEGGQSFSDYAAALEDCSGTSAQMAETQLDNLSGKM
ncbi:MAG: phage tail tape measure protein, partial [Bacteroidales bacterium]|nr:phage tail tape measure protein [Bacteroidales bacterium]